MVLTAGEPPRRQTLQRALVIALFGLQEGIGPPPEAIRRALAFLELEGHHAPYLLAQLDRQQQGQGETTRSLVTMGIWDWLTGDHDIHEHWLVMLGRRLGEVAVAVEATGESWTQQRAVEIYEDWLTGADWVSRGMYGGTDEPE